MTKEIKVNGIELSVGDAVLVVTDGRNPGYNLGIVPEQDGVKRSGGLHECLSLEDPCALIYEKYFGIEFPTFKRRGKTRFDVTFILEVIVGFNPIADYIEKNMGPRYAWHADLIRKMAEAQGERK